MELQLSRRELARSCCRIIDYLSTSLWARANKRANFTDLLKESTYVHKERIGIQRWCSYCGFFQDKKRNYHLTLEFMLMWALA